MISINFIEQLPPSSGYTSILVVVDQLSKQGIFIATHDTITSSDLALLFIIHIFSKHGVLASDGKVRFSSVQYPKFANPKPNRLFRSAVFRNLERNVAFRFKKHSVQV